MSAKGSSQVDATNTADNSCHPEEDLGASVESDIPENRRITGNPEDVHENQLIEALIQRQSAPIPDCDPASFELQTLDRDQESACAEENSYGAPQQSEVR